VKPSLLGIHYSPWSQKARHALAAADVDYDYTEYQPVFGEPMLRMKAKQWRGRVSVPILLTDGGALRDSFEIAQFAAAQTPSLIPPGYEDIVATWNERSDRLLALGRRRTTALVKADPAALLENLPKPLRKMGPVSRGLGVFGARFLQKKYDMDTSTSLEACEAEMRSILVTLRGGLATGAHLIGSDLTYADITMAVSLTFVKPHGDVRIGRQSRPHWSVDALVEEFSSLFEWRDAIYAR
jgi:glutathione S-transferase